MSFVVSDVRIRIVALGDSTTAGTPGFLSPLEAPPAGRGDETSQYSWWLMHAHPEWNVMNRGVNGERSDEIRARFARDVLDVKPALVIIIAGVNDIYQGRSAGDVIEELQAMYEAASHAGIRVVAGSIVPFNTATADQTRTSRSWIPVAQWRIQTIPTRSPIPQMSCIPLPMAIGAWARRFCPRSSACSNIRLDLSDISG
jgi:lysophospholipase L1-like esterase